MVLSDQLNERLYENIRGDGNIVEYLQRLVRKKVVDNLSDAMSYLNDPDNPISLMHYLVRKERYEDASWLKKICEATKL